VELHDERFQTDQLTEREPMNKKRN
jgi:hypothetical protein